MRFVATLAALGAITFGVMAGDPDPVPGLTIYNKTDTTDLNNHLLAAKAVPFFVLDAPTNLGATGFVSSIGTTFAPASFGGPLHSTDTTQYPFLAGGVDCTIGTGMCSNTDFVFDATSTATVTANTQGAGTKIPSNVTGLFNTCFAFDTTKVGSVAAGAATDFGLGIMVVDVNTAGTAPAIDDVPQYANRYLQLDGLGTEGSFSTNCAWTYVIKGQYLTFGVVPTGTVLKLTAAGAAAGSPALGVGIAFGGYFNTSTATKGVVVALASAAATNVDVNDVRAWVGDSDSTACTYDDGNFTTSTANACFFMYAPGQPMAVKATYSVATGADVAFHAFAGPTALDDVGFGVASRAASGDWAATYTGEYLQATLGGVAGAVNGGGYLLNDNSFAMLDVYSVLVAGFTKTTAEAVALQVTTKISDSLAVAPPTYVLTTDTAEALTGSPTAPGAGNCIPGSPLNSHHYGASYYAGAGDSVFTTGTTTAFSGPQTASTLCRFGSHLPFQAAGTITFTVTVVTAANAVSTYKVAGVAQQHFTANGAETSTTHYGNWGLTGSANFAAGYTATEIAALPQAVDLTLTAGTAVTQDVSVGVGFGAAFDRAVLGVVCEATGCTPTGATIKVETNFTAYQGSTKYAGDGEEAIANVKNLVAGIGALPHVATPATADGFLVTDGCTVSTAGVVSPTTTTTPTPAAPTLCTSAIPVWRIPLNNDELTGGDGRFSKLLSKLIKILTGKDAARQVYTGELYANATVAAGANLTIYVANVTEAVLNPATVSNFTVKDDDGNYLQATVNTTPVKLDVEFPAATATMPTLPSGINVFVGATPVMRYTFTTATETVTDVKIVAVVNSAGSIALAAACGVAALVAALL